VDDLVEGGIVTYIQELQDVIRKLHGVESEHVESVPVKEMFRGTMIWDGVVEVFNLKGHPIAARVYAWAHDTDDPEHPRRHVTVLHHGFINTPYDAVKAAIVQEIKSLGTAEEI
jgi:hypothetical protein